MECGVTSRKYWHIGQESNKSYCSACWQAFLRLVYPRWSSSMLQVDFIVAERRRQEKEKLVRLVESQKLPCSVEATGVMLNRKIGKGYQRSILKTTCGQLPWRQVFTTQDYFLTEWGPIGLCLMSGICKRSKDTQLRSRWEPPPCEDSGYRIELIYCCSKMTDSS